MLPTGGGCGCCWERWPAPGLGAAPALPHFERALEGLRKDRDLARFPPSRATQLTNLDAWLGRPEVQVRRFVERFLHGKAYLFGDSYDARAALVTSANLTNAGLSHNLELGLAHYDPLVAAAAVGWFDGLWDQAEEFKAELQELLFPDPGLIDPQTVYLRALLELFDEETVPVPPLSTVNPGPVPGRTVSVGRWRSSAAAMGLSTRMGSVPEKPRSDSRSSKSTPAGGAATLWW